MRMKIGLRQFSIAVALCGFMGGVPRLVAQETPAQETQAQESQTQVAAPEGAAGGEEGKAVFVFAGEDGKSEKVTAQEIVIVASEENEEGSEGGKGLIFVTEGDAEGVFDLKLGNDARADFVADLDVAVSMSEYYIGVVCDSVGDALRSHLKIEANQGLIVTEVVPDAPAAKAGLQVHDVILAVNENKVGTVMDLMKGIDSAKGAELKLSVIRQGGPVIAAVTPVKRPEGNQANMKFQILNEQGQPFRAFLNRIDHREGEKGKFLALPRKLRVFHKGAVVNLAEQEQLNNLSVSINKNGAEPAKISIKQGDRAWEVIEGHLGELPEDVRKHVEAMLKGGSGGESIKVVPGGMHGLKLAPFSGKARFVIENATPGSNEAIVAEGVELIGAAPIAIGASQNDELKKELMEMKEQLKQIHAMLEEIRRK